MNSRYKCPTCGDTVLQPDENGVITCGCGYVNMVEAFLTDEGWIEEAGNEEQVDG